jgi:hypothetical protein
LSALKTNPPAGPLPAPGQFLVLPDEFQGLVEIIQLAGCLVHRGVAADQLQIAPVTEGTQQFFQSPLAGIVGTQEILETGEALETVGQGLVVLDGFQQPRKGKDVAGIQGGVLLLALHHQVQPFHHRMQFHLELLEQLSDLRTRLAVEFPVGGVIGQLVLGRREGIAELAEKGFDLVAVFGILEVAETVFGGDFAEEFALEQAFDGGFEHLIFHSGPVPWRMRHIRHYRKALHRKSL